MNSRIACIINAVLRYESAMDIVHRTIHGHKAYDAIPNVYKLVYEYFMHWILSCVCVKRQARAAADFSFKLFRNDIMNKTIWWNSFKILNYFGLLSSINIFNQNVFQCEEWDRERSRLHEFGMHMKSREFSLFINLIRRWVMPKIDNDSHMRLEMTNGYFCMQTTIEEFVFFFESVKNDDDLN